jgi:hypothetical protein
MLAVEKWAQDKNPVIAFFAINLALMARLQCDALRHIKDRSIFGYHFPLPDLSSWFALYPSRRPLFAYKRLISHSSEFVDQQINVMSEIKKLEKALKKDPHMIIKYSDEEIATSLAMWRDMCSKTYDEIQDEISKSRMHPKMYQDFEGTIQKYELTLSFYYLVYVPCLLIHGTSPSKLYQKALSGEVNAIEKLLNIDPLILHNPDIGYQMQSIRLKGKANYYDRLLTAISKSPTVSYKDMRKQRKIIKTDHGASIYILAKGARKPLQMPQIRMLYDALAKDFEGIIQDTDITSTEGFDKTVKAKAAVRQKQNQKLEKQK